jgi:glycosyltransferase involved in cell wall biosynthesis
MGNSEPAKIVGITLVRNEDIFVERAIRNAIDFCDLLIVADHLSTDETPAIVGRLAAEYPGKIRVERIQEARESHFLVNGYANTQTWIFAVDGDELYDRSGLAVLRDEILSGKYDRWWILFGNVLNCTEIDEVNGTATGYLSPPCRSMTKLFNFNAIESWGGAVTHVLANGTPIFKLGYDASLRLSLHEEILWEESHYRCLHTCFMRRSSLDAEGVGARPNVSESLHGGVLTFLRKTLNRVLKKPAVSDWKMEKYARGALTTTDAKPFL